MAGDAELSQGGRLVRLEVENFKSYKGHKKIGPFKGFTAVIGPNGSGKSNLMDAISFVLGVKTAQLRGSLKELLYHNTDGGSAMDRPRRGYVKLVFETAEGDTVEFSRVITPSGTSSEATYQSQYKINDRNCTWEQYNKKLKSFGILVKARNFLVFQGDIESVAAMSPKDLTNLFEQISGSEALRKDYEELEQAKNEADEKTSFLFSKKKTTNLEKRQKKEQKEEAEKHIQALKELEDMKVDYFLWQLFHIDHDIGQAAQDIDHQTSGVEAAEAKQSQTEAQIKERKVAQATRNKERLLLEKKINKRKLEIDKKNPTSVKRQEEINRLTKRLKLAEKDLAEKAKQQEGHKSKVEKLARDLAAITSAQKQLEEDLAAEQGRDKLALDERALREYNAIKEDVGAKTCKLQQDKDALQSTQQADQEALRALEDTVTSISERMQQLEAEQAKALAHAEGMARGAQDTQQLLQAKKAERGALTDNNRRAAAQREYLTQKLEEVEGQLRDAKADRKESDRDRKMADAVVNMKRLFPGVFGRVTELAKVMQRRYNMALAVVMGKDMDSVIVDTEKTARECIVYLKEQMVPPMTFIPVHTVKAKPVNERLRQLGGTAKLAIDLLEYDSQLERAMLSVCGNTLVCDGVEEAKRLAFLGAERHKVVALDGTQFNKAGLITGGLSGNMEARASRWDDKAMEGLKKDRAKYGRELAEVPGGREAQQQEQRLTSEITGLETKLKYNRTDEKHTAEKLAGLEKELAALGQEKRKKTPGATMLEKSIKDRQMRIDAIQTRINEISDRLFTAFSAKVGVSNIREYEENHLRHAEEVAKQKLELSNQVAKLKNQLAYEKSTDLVKKIRQREQEIDKDKALLEKLKQEESRSTETAEKFAAELTAQQEQVAALKVQADEIEAEVKELRKLASQQQAEAAKLRRMMGSKEVAVEQLRSRRADVLESAAIGQVELPQRQASSGSELEADAAGPSSAAAAAGPCFDCARLQRQHRATLTASSRDKLDAEFKGTLEEQSAALERVAPNLKAVEQYEAVKERERAQAEELEAARLTAKSATESFNAIRQKRHDLFMAAFDHISSSIDTIFKDLTKSPMHPMGGTAYLSLESQDEPFLNGIKFTAMPPTKRYRNMEDLSGGEKTVAALALLFAIHSYQPSPFFVLDEIDAALDATNVAKVATYIREKTRTDAEGSFQSIVISLKDNFYEKADALVGVCRDTDLGCSATFTFDLNRFG